MSTLFSYAHKQDREKSQPLAARMRPRTLAEYVGQRHILAPGRLLHRAIQADQLASLIFYGPPGTGKTTLASVIANSTKSFFVTLNAVMAGIADLRDITKAAQRRAEEYQQRTILFVDEVHRWNKAQQDALLPWVENGTVILIGATTENPFFTVNKALVSRSRIFQLKPLQDSEIEEIILQALEDEERGYAGLSAVLEDAALKHLAQVANGDARAALNALELAVETTVPNEAGNRVITLEVAEESIQRRAVLYDREGDYHFDTISAFIKSMRGSDPDATLYWLAKMLYAGEDPRFIFRRMLIFASEDIGMADPQALTVINSAAEAFDRVGLPEGHFALAQAAIYCACAEKSNSVMGFFKAFDTVSNERDAEVPNHLRDSSRDKEGFGHGKGYKYPHAYREHWVAQQYLPTAMQGKVFYQPSEQGYEKLLTERVLQRRELQLSAVQEEEQQPLEILSFSPPDTELERWLARSISGRTEQLQHLRDKVLKQAKLQRHSLVLDLEAETALFLWEEMRQTPEGGVWVLSEKAETANKLNEQMMNFPELRKAQVLQGQIEAVPEILHKSQEEGILFDFISGRNIFAKAKNRKKRLQILSAMLAEEGKICSLENIPRYGLRLSSLIENNQEWLPELREIEEKVYNDPEDELLNWDENTLIQELDSLGLNSEIEEINYHREKILQAAEIQRWFAMQKGSYADRMLKKGLKQETLDKLQQKIQQQTKIKWQSKIIMITVSG